jgi:hypothetical protein
MDQVVHQEQLVVRGLVEHQVLVVHQELPVQVERQGQVEHQVVRGLMVQAVHQEIQYLHKRVLYGQQLKMLKLPAH